MAVSTKLSRKDMRRREKSRRQFTSQLFWSAVVVLILAAIGYWAWQFSTTPRLGVSIPVMGAKHIQVGEQHEPYNSDPPTSGPHYVQPALAGFYDEALPDEQLVHNLEHGYVVIWYNCKDLEEAACDTLKTQIRSDMDQAGPVGPSGSNKLIAVPRSSLSVSVVATSWGRLYKLDTFNPDELLVFIKQYRNKAPEPGAP